MKKISVLMSLYDKESPCYFNMALESLHEQKYKPDEVILVLDGPINNELYAVINKWLTILPIILVPLDKNVGLAKALNNGIQYCHYDYIARMDTDDICNPDRFLMQFNYLSDHQNIDVVGTWISEINEDNKEIRSEVRYPLTHSELYDFFSKRDPLAHPTVMFRKSFFEKAGDYPIDIPLGEDTALWFSGFKNNCQFANIPYVGLKFRRTSNFYLRRANKEKTIALLKFRISKINKELGYGLSSNIYAIFYALLAISPTFVKRLLYTYLR